MTTPGDCGNVEDKVPGRGARKPMDRCKAESSLQRPAGQVYLSRAEFSITLGFVKKVGTKREEGEQSPPSEHLDTALFLELTGICLGRGDN